MIKVKHEAMRKRAERVRLKAEQGIFYAEEVQVKLAADVLKLAKENEKRDKMIKHLVKWFADEPLTECIEGCAVCPEIRKTFYGE